MAEQNKKRTAVVATAVAAALLLTGTFAWNMATDQTILNEFQEEDKGDYQVKLDEDFDPDDPWANKDVFVTNEGDNPVIVRVRLEEFYDLTYRDGTNYDAKEGYSQSPSTDGSSAIFVPNGEVTDNEDQSSTKLADKVSLIFGNNDGSVAAMAEYKAMDETAKADIKWVIDSDGWCYYTRALLAGETTENLLDKATFNKELFEQTYDSPYDLDYKINVRLQAISADLEDFGSHVNNAQWTNCDSIDEAGKSDYSDGRQITEDERDDNFEITTDTTITNDARDLVLGIHNTYTNEFANADGSIGTKVSTFEELKAALKDSNIHSILLTSDIDFTECVIITSDKLIELGEYTINCSQALKNNSMMIISNGHKLVLKHGSINSDQSFIARTNKTDNEIELVGINANTKDQPAILATKDNSIRIYGSNLSSENYAPILLLESEQDVNASTNVYVNGSTLIANNGAPILQNGYIHNVNLTIENNSVIKSTKSQGVFLGPGWTLNAKDSTIEGAEYGIAENHLKAPKYANIENCTISARYGCYKATDSELTMKNCIIKGVGSHNPDNSSSGYTAVGICVRAGDVTLDNVQVTTEQGTFPDSDFIWSDAELTSRYNNSYYANGPVANFEAIQVILNQYESINLNIIGGSYSSGYQGHDRNGDPVTMRSVYIHDSTYSIHDSSYTYNNSITVSGNPTFSPATDMFNGTYANTTITQQ